MYGTVVMPSAECNYCKFEMDKLSPIINKGESVLPEIKTNLENSHKEEDVIENLYVLDRMLDNGVKGIDNLYPTLSKFNQTTSPNIQTFLAGIYRKIKVPDAFGPLCAMLIRNSINPPNDAHFDPNEEIGGAILDYLA